ncbi:glycosyl transferase family 2 [Thioalkalivibrio sp. K90mix]|uniref:TIGR04283 family arsenosugar biosynthesis glycosyltransferase n=1 Tax=unclassified Thioalkalivibrio TaxID=2621013 RepID=UPI000195AB55|nr:MULTISPECIES: TIGR04283 family arsenosugar biosynthesis glycosyltransferase [unclassified Thioalkalivibrio]ADC71175.1 glycosyl transferase family 2 [Thioalkalivibrio sp. K90mix]
MSRESPFLSVIIPVLNEAESLPPLLDTLGEILDCEVIVVDGGSTDGTVQQAGQCGVSVLSSAPGRARQMNAGAERARGEALWFLHADTTFPDGAGVAVHALRDAVARDDRAWGRFDVRLSGGRGIFALIAAMMNLRSRLSGIATGDQGIFITRSAFDAVGGWPDQPLMEDIELSRRLKRSVGRPRCLRTWLVTSSRRWERQGAWRTIWLMWRLRLAYWLGANPDGLARLYRGDA